MPNNIPSQPEFPIVRRGFDPDSVDRYLGALQRELEDRVAAAEAKYANIEAALTEAHKREEAVHLTLVAATKTKEEMLVNARREAEQTMTRSREQADALLSEAKKEAFRLMTDARQTAQETTTVARAGSEESRAAAQVAAESIRDKARLEAIEMINSVETDTTSLLAAREAALAEMRLKYEEEEAGLNARIDGLRTAAGDLESRLKAIATGSLGAASHLVSDLPTQPAARVQEAPPAPEPTAAPMPEPQPMSAPRPATPARVVPKARPPIPAEMTEAYLTAARAEPAAEPATTTNGVARSVAAAAAIPTEEIAAQEIAAAELAAAERAATAELAAAEARTAEARTAELRAVEARAAETRTAEVRAAEMAEARRRAAAVEMPQETSLNGHTYVETVDLEETAEELAAVPTHDSDPASRDTEADAEPAASEELETEEETEEETEKVPVTVGVASPKRPFEDERGRKGSYYSRRSAKLPRIGNEAGRNALAAANAIRGASRGMPVDDD